MSGSPATSLLEEARLLVEAELRARLPQGDDRLAKAMRYAALGPGKRVRPALMVAVAAALDLARDRVRTAAAAVEMVHAFSLVHDDLPALDNDRLRRGRETVHIAFDEATAILVGDALLNQAFAVLVEPDPDIDASQRCRAVATLARAVGARGMIGGQMLDLAADDLSGDAQALERIHRAKTGALMRVCGEIPAVYAALEPDKGSEIGDCCERIGLVFQIRDDLLDVVQNSEALGKTAGKDQRQRKLTYPAMLGVDGAERRLQEVHREAVELAARMPGDSSPLRALIDFVADRQH